MSSTERTPDSRPSFDEYFLGVAQAVSRRGDCTRSQVGAVVVGPDRRIWSTGYNGVAAGGTGCLANGCPRGQLQYSELGPGGDYSNCTADHAERNALSYLAAWYGDYTLYVTREPCRWCKELAFGEYEVYRIRWPDGEEYRGGN